MWAKALKKPPLPSFRTSSSRATTLRKNLLTQGLSRKVWSVPELEPYCKVLLTSWFVAVAPLLTFPLALPVLPALKGLKVLRRLRRPRRLRLNSLRKQKPSPIKWPKREKPRLSPKQHLLPPLPPLRL